MIKILYIAVIVLAETYNTACGGRLARSAVTDALMRAAANTVSAVFILNIRMLIHLL